MSEILKVLVSSHMRLKPVSPPTSQVIACPVGYEGAGETQTRTSTWNVASQSWVVGDWVTTEFNCQISQFTFVGPDLAYDNGTGWVSEQVGPVGDRHTYITYDKTLEANGHTARIRARYEWLTRMIQYEVWAPTLAGRLCRPHWKAEAPSVKGPESTWQAFEVLDPSGYLFVPPRSEPEYGYGPPKNIKFGEANGCNIDIR